ncbi:DUF5317 domain-containing protein [Fusibacter paucivorans]|uniref:DUF5317 domain-containing protein n=1 Tax=Fusibacter paucivorans TaxID=76009 RepID=A0ABS5PLH8_9FIRM|nr:DUF5317 family protein [Fusibacter paucivorans]MBS7525777.1 DUF5317 domain-containing protein [Fusibacter paucivorans]
MIIEAILIGFLLGFFRNGRLNNFADMRFKGSVLIVLSFFVYISPFALRMMQIDMAMPQILPFAAGIIAMVVALVNHEKGGVKLIMLGGVINLLIMGMNQFRMPVPVSRMASSGLASLAESVGAGSVINYVDMANASFLAPYLGKIIVMPAWYPLNQLISIGDIIMSIGIILLVQGEMMMFSSKRGAMVTFQYHVNK